MKNVRKWLFLGLVIMLGAFVVSGLGKGSVCKADSLTTDDGLSYFVSDCEIVVTSYDGNAKEFTIPKTIDGKRVTTVMGFARGSSLESIEIPDSVTSIYHGAFSGQRSLTKIVVESGNPRYDSRENCNAIIETDTNTLISGCKATTIPDSVTSIGVHAFYYCSSLETITIPDSVTSIGQYAFEACSGLTKIVVESGNSRYDSRNKCNAIIETETNTLMSGCKVTSIPDTVTTIGRGAFCYCEGLTRIVIPNSVTRIGNFAFDGCSSLESIEIPGNVTSIGNCAFRDCSGLGSITIPAKVVELGDSAFAFCSGLTKITIPDSVTYIGWGAFDEIASDATFYVIKDSYADEYLSQHYLSYKIERGDAPMPPEVRVPQKGSKVKDTRSKFTYEVTVSGTVNNGKVNGAEVAFQSAGKNAKSVTIPKTVTVEGVTYKVTSIKDSAFKNNKKLTKITVSENVVKIGENAFYGCKKLKTVTVKSSKLKSVGKNAWKGIDNKATIKVPKKMKKAYKKLFTKKTGFKNTMKIK